MTENEYLILISNLREEATVQTQFFIAIFSAYILVIYAVGKKLSTLYLSLLTLSYSLFIAIPIIASRVAISNIAAIAESYAIKYPDAIVEHVLIPYLPSFSTALLIFCWCLSIAYMLTNRR
jgi:hypothetical protein